MAQIDWVVMPSIWWENSPVVIQEAFHHRRPVICSDIGGMAEKVQHGINGLHFRVGSAEDLADRLTEAMTDTALWKELSAGCPEPLTAAACAAAHAALYTELMADRSQQPAASAASAVGTTSAPQDDPGPPARARQARRTRTARTGIGAGRPA
jgi:hypothetical protein